MERYLRAFANHSDYTAFTGSSEFVKPNVSLCELEEEVHYNELVTNPVVSTVLVDGNTAGEDSDNYWFYNVGTYRSGGPYTGTCTVQISGENLSNCSISLYNNLGRGGHCSLTAVSQSSDQITVNVYMNKADGVCVMRHCGTYASLYITLNENFVANVQLCINNIGACAE